MKSVRSLCSYVHKGGLKPDSFHFISFTAASRAEGGEFFPVN